LPKKLVSGYRHLAFPGWKYKWCTSCKHQASITAGTIFQDTRTPLAVWFRAMWWVASQKNGASALGFQRILGLKSYETAWTWLPKFRRAMIRLGRDILSGSVEVDECSIGSPESFGLGGFMSMSTKICCSFAGRTNSCSSMVFAAASRIEATMNSFRLTPRRVAALWKKVFCSGSTRASSRSEWGRRLDRILRAGESIRYSVD